MACRTVHTAIVSMLVGIMLAANAVLVGADGPCILDNAGNCASVVLASTNGANDSTLLSTGGDATSGGFAMWSLIGIPLTCWLCVLVAFPRKPLPGNEVEELVYARLLGRQQRLVLLAFLISAVAVITFVIHLPGRVLSTEDAPVQQAQPVVCDTPMTGSGVCWVGRPGGMWTVERHQPDGSVHIEDYVSGPPPDGRGASP
jgi:hypothetical protein